MESVQQEPKSTLKPNASKDNSSQNPENIEASRKSVKSFEREDVNQSTSMGSMKHETLDKNAGSLAKPTSQDPFGRFFSVSFVGSIERGYFNSVNDVHVKFSIVAGPDWILGAGMDVGITQIARRKLDKNERQQFIWNQPISISYKSYNFFGWPQLVLSVYNFDTFGNDVILGYGCTYLPVCKSIQQLTVPIFSPRSPSLAKRFLCFITGKKPELVNAALIARQDCRCVLQMVKVGEVDILFNTISKDILSNGYRAQ